jgi:hypothetical protein
VYVCVCVCVCVCDITDVVSARLYIVLSGGWAQAFVIAQQFCKASPFPSLDADARMLVFQAMIRQCVTPQIVVQACTRVSSLCRQNNVGP